MKNILSKKQGISAVMLVLTIVIIVAVVIVYVVGSSKSRQNDDLNSNNSGDINVSGEEISGEIELINLDIRQSISNNIGDFVEYPIEYTDVYYSEYKYTKDNGWRLLTQRKNDDGTFDIEIISTGVPAKLNYYHKTISNFESDGTASKWAGTESQRNAYANTFYSSINLDNNNSNVYAASGLYLNFDKISFIPQSEYNVLGSKSNRGSYTLIEGSLDSGEGLFRAKDFSGDKIASIRNVALSDITGKTDATTTWKDKDDVKGLFKLSNISGKEYSKGWYWLASPNASNDNYLRYVGCDGYFDSNFRNTYGVRPVILLKGIEMEKENNVWKIK